MPAAPILTTWISNWAGATGAASATTVQLTAPPVQSVGQSLNFPARRNRLSEHRLYAHQQVLRRAAIHRPRAPRSNRRSSPIRRSRPPIRPRSRRSISRDACRSTATTCGTNSRFYQRLLTDNHNCWTDCASDAALMLGQIQAFAQMLTPTNIDPTLVISKALASRRARSQAAPAATMRTPSPSTSSKPAREPSPTIPAVSIPRRTSPSPAT